MQFRLPQQLQTELLAYDPTLKALAKQSDSESKAKKPKNHLGLPPGLIPVDVVRQSLYDDALQIINSNELVYRFHEFTRITNVATPQAAVTTYAILYHYEQCWYAAWLPPKGKENDYVYGYSFAFKDTQSAYKNLKPLVSELFKEGKCTTIPIANRKAFIVYQEFVTKQDIINGHRSKNWNIPCVARYYKKAEHLMPAILRFEKELKSTIPSWDDSSGIFDRISRQSLTDLIKYHWNHDFTNDISLSAQSIIDAINDDLHLLAYGKYKSILKIIDTPFFRKYIQSLIDESQQLFDDITTTSVRKVLCNWHRILKLLERIKQINEIWPDCPIDYYQTYFQILIVVKWYKNGTHLTKEWLNQNMPVASFFNNLQQAYEKIDQSEYGRCFDKDLNLKCFRYDLWDDTISMLDSVLAYNQVATTPIEIQTPKRWRLSEFHDYIQVHAWKVEHKNESLPQDLFPTPIKLIINQTQWTFFQPIDTHQLAAWGRAVRNCVGSAGTYADGVRKKKHFIVLCMIDNKPEFTIQLNVDMGMMSVKQITGVANKSLTAEQTEQYTKAFSQALQQRESELKSV